MIRRTLLCTATALAVGAGAAPSHAQDAAWPGKPVIIENIGGAGGTSGTGRAVKIPLLFINQDSALQHVRAGAGLQDLHRLRPG